MNHITVFSNGLADFRKNHKVKAGERKEVLIPVKAEHVADVLATINVTGNGISLPEPPSFNPKGEDSQLEVDSEDVLQSLCKKLTGAAVKITGLGDKPLTGRLLGTQEMEKAVPGGEPIRSISMVVDTEGGIRFVGFDNFFGGQLEFTNENVKAEIRKAFDKKFQQINPDGKFVKLTLTASAETEATVQYTVPAAAWKTSYRLRDPGTGIFDFEGFAIVDNNTNEDWQDVYISVVNGNPITFGTDLADSKIPSRRFENVVNEDALGNVEVQRSVKRYTKSMARSAGAAPAMAFAAAAGHSADSVELCSVIGTAGSPGPQGPQGPSTAFEACFDVEDVGDLCVYKSKNPVSIASKSAALIPIFATQLEDAESVLFYRTVNHRNHPWSAVRFRNETANSLGKGMLTIFQKGTFAGSAVLNATKPSEERLIPHSLENGVHVLPVVSQQEAKLLAFRINDSTSYMTYGYTQESVYTFTNNTDKEFELVLDHDQVLYNSEISAGLIDSEYKLEKAEKTASGMRFTFKIGPKTEVGLSVKEKRVDEQRAVINTNGNLENWLLGVVLKGVKTSLLDDKALQKCFKIQKDIDEANQETQKLSLESQRHEAKQVRLRANLGAGSTDQQSNEWRKELGEYEKKITELQEKKIPDAQEKAGALRESLIQALKKVSVEYKA